MKSIYIFLIASSIQAIWGDTTTSHCPIMDCECEDLNEYTFKAMCPPKEHGTEYAVTYNTKTGLVLIDCVRNTNLTEGFLKIFEFPQQRSMALHFRMCGPPEIPFASLIRPLTVTSLTFSTFGHWSDMKADLFAGMKDLTQLNLKGNDIEHVSGEVFSHLDSLTSLTLSENALQSVPSRLNEFLPKLESLDLGMNNISILKGDDFVGLAELRELILFNNSIKNLSGKIFDDIPHLKALDLRGNLLRALTAEVFENLLNLERLDISNNKLMHLPDDLLHANGKLTYLAISGNWNLSQLFEPTLQNLTLLEELDLSRNNFTVLPEKLFESSMNLKVLDLNENRISYLYPTQFDKCPNLRVLNLRANRIKNIEPGTFKTLNNLEKLDLTRNQIRLIEGKTFSGFRAMTSIDLSYNNISQINTTAFVNSSIALMNISYNPFMFTDRNPAFILPEDVQLINITRTFMVRVPLPWIRSNTLKELDLRRNRLMTLQVENPPPQNIPHILNIYIEGNLIEEVEMISMNRSSNTRANRFEKFIIQYNMENNPLKCDCNLLPFVQYMRSENHDISSTVKFLGLVKCISPINLENAHVESLSDDDLTCQVLKDCTPGCYCLTKGSEKNVHLSCAKMNFEEFPRIISERTSHMDLTSNYISAIPNLTSPIWNKLNQVDLGYNSLTNLTKPIFLPANLTFLALNNNLIKILPPWFMTEILKRNMKVLLGNNPWECSCETIPTIKWLQRNANNIGDMNNMHCAGAIEKDRLLIMSLNTTRFCPPLKIHSGVSAACVLLLLFIVIIVTMIVSTLVFRKRSQGIKLWLFRHHMCLWMMKDDDRASGHPL